MIRNQRKDNLNRITITPDKCNYLIDSFPVRKVKAIYYFLMSFKCALVFYV